MYANIYIYVYKLCVCIVCLVYRAINKDMKHHLGLHRRLLCCCNFRVRVTMCSVYTRPIGELWFTPPTNIRFP